MKEKIVIGSRGSKLAMIQAESVAAQLKERNPNLDISISRIATEGDRNQTLNLSEAGDIGIFIRALEEALIAGKIDMAVHSLKDLPLATPAALGLNAVTRRLDPRDTLVSYAPLSGLKPGARIGTSSTRRAAQLINVRKDITVTWIRGNVDSRLRKVDVGEFDGVIVAAAALIRLGLTGRIADYLDVEQFLPSAGQGALGIETRHDDNDIWRLVDGLNDVPTWQAITAEREFLRTLGGGCSAPISCLATVEEGLISISGMVSDKKGIKILKDTLKEPLINPELTGFHLAKRMLEKGAQEILDEIKRK